MDLTLPAPDRAPEALRALAAVARANGEPHPQQQRMLELFAEATGVPVDVPAPCSITPEALAAALTDPRARRAFVQRLVVMATLDGEVTEGEVDQIEAFATALDVHEPGVRNLRQIARGYPRLAAISLGRRSFVPRLLAKVWRERGLRGVFQLVRALLRGRDRAQEARFAALAELPRDTLGRELYEHFVDNAFPFPGQPRAAPEFLLFHDLGHVLGGYGTSSGEELLIAGFQAGYMKGDGLVMYLMIAMFFQLGIESVARMRGVEPARERVDIEALLSAVERGQAMTVNLVDWDPWPHMARPLSEVRAELGVRHAPLH